MIFKFFFYNFCSGNDEWIRIEVVRGDLIVIPKGIYHRFTLDANVIQNLPLLIEFFCYRNQTKNKNNFLISLVEFYQSKTLFCW